MYKSLNNSIDDNEPKKKNQRDKENRISYLKSN